MPFFSGSFQHEPWAFEKAIPKYQMLCCRTAHTIWLSNAHMHICARTNTFNISYSWLDNNIHILIWNAFLLLEQLLGPQCLQLSQKTGVWALTHNNDMTQGPNLSFQCGHTARQLLPDTKASIQAAESRSGKGLGPLRHAFATHLSTLTLHDGACEGIYVNACSQSNRYTTDGHRQCGKKHC